MGQRRGGFVRAGFRRAGDSDASVILAATPAALAAIGALGLPTGHFAFVTAMRTNGGSGLYILQPAVSSTPDSFFVIATADDATRQWVYYLIQEQGTVGYLGDEIDLTVAPQTIVILPPLIGFRFVLSQAFQWVITVKNGTVTTGPFCNTGTDATFTDVCANANSLTAATNLDQAAAFQGTTTNPGPNNKDLTTRGLKTQITVGAALGTATLFKARIRGILTFAKY